MRCCARPVPSINDASIDADHITMVQTMMMGSVINSARISPADMSDHQSSDMRLLCAMRPDPPKSPLELTKAILFSRVNFGYSWYACR